jgi:RNA polymerase sigma factor (sigma-70 family)
MERRTGDPAAAEDIASSAAEALVRRIEADGIDAVYNLEGLFRVIAHGLWVDYVRDNFVGEVDELLLRESPIGLSDELDKFAQQRTRTYEDATFAQDFDAALRGLEEPERDVFILTDLRGLSQRAAGAVLGVSQPTVQARADAARALIREELT